MNKFNSNIQFLLSLMLVLFCLPAIAQEDENSIPVVPASVAKAGMQSPPSSSSAQNADDSSFVVNPGTNVIVKVAVNHLNRFVTPFETPEIKTQSTAMVTEIAENVVYIGTDQQDPVTVYIKEKGSEEQAISLTLIPIQIPPREITLKLPDSNPLNFVGTAKARKWEEAQPYVATLELLLRTVALGDMPRGYKLANTPQGQLPACRQAGLQFDFANGQSLIGSNLDVQIGVITNVSNIPIEFVEDTCGDWNVAAVSVFPRHTLQPFEKTEVYVVIKKNMQKAIAPKRRSLVQ